MKKILILKHISIEGPGTLGEFLRQKKIDCEILDVSKDRETILSQLALKDIAGVVILGGPMNVYEEDKYPFLKSEKHFIKELVANKVPLLGVCLGAQLIACSLGAKVKKAPQKEIGWYNIRLEDNAKADPIFKDLNDEIKVFQWHEDTFDLPQHAVLLAKSDGMNQAFRFKENTWGFQFHVEVDGEMIRSWYCDYMGEGKSSDSWKQMIQDYLITKDEFNQQARIVYSAFLNVVRA